MVTLEEAKAHLRVSIVAADESGAIGILENEDDAALQKMVEAAADHLASIGVDMSAEPFPPAIRHAVLMLVGHFYGNREAVSDAQVRTTPLGVDRLIAPYRSVSL